MIGAHTFDAWTRPDVRATAAFRNVTILGGFAAPLFLWLAGVGVVMAATNAARRSGDRASGVNAACRRGLEIFVLAFLFRLQGLIVSPGGHLVTLFRVDILNIMGPAMVVAALVWGITTNPARRVVLYVALAVATTMLTPIVRVSPLVARLPTFLQWYVRPFGDLTIFTVFPWTGFVFAGAACGVLLWRPRMIGWSGAFTSGSRSPVSRSSSRDTTPHRCRQSTGSPRSGPLRRPTLRSAPACS